MENGKHHAFPAHAAGEPTRLHGGQAFLYGRKNVDGKGGPPAKVPAAAPASAIATPAENYNFHANAAADKNAYPFTKLVVLGILAGGCRAGAAQQPQLLLLVR